MWGVNGDSMKEWYQTLDVAQYSDGSRLRCGALVTFVVLRGTYNRSIMLQLGGSTVMASCSMWEAIQQLDQDPGGEQYNNWTMPHVRSSATLGPSPCGSCTAVGPSSSW